MGRPLNVVRLGDGGPQVDRLLLATLPCPIARTDGTSLSTRIAVGELAHALVVLGHSAPSDELTDEVEALLAAVLDTALDTDVARLVGVGLVPTDESVSALAAWPGWRATSWGLDAWEHTNVPVRAVFDDEPFDPAVLGASLRLSADTAAGVVARRAQAAGADVAVRATPAGRLARIGSHAVVAHVDGVDLTPPIDDGAPVDGWRDRMVERGELVERSIEVGASLQLSIITPSGQLRPVELLGTA